ncbi:MAG: hypothetical protein AAF915_16495 [Cyanobacteria bacterium P01_D01_bin.50]
MSHSTEQQPSQRKTICNDCAFQVLVNNSMQCTHPLELGVNCSAVTFCSSFQPAVEVDSPCVSFDEEE